MSMTQPVPTVSDAFPVWRFRKMSPAEPNQDSVVGEFFSSVSDLPERFVRETIQNAMDARREDHLGPVKVRFGFSGAQGALTGDRKRRYIARLEDHICAVASRLSARPAATTSDDDSARRAYDPVAVLDQPLTYLTVGDFGTRGLQGDIRGNSPFEKDNHFWGFFRSIGISPKTGTEGGSWGLGKWVFTDASIINASFGVTLSVGAPGGLMMGQAVLQTHKIDAAKYPPHGSFAIPDNADDHEWLPMPSCDQGDIARLCYDFGLTRFASAQAEPGLSVIVPYPKAELTPDSIKKAVVLQYLFAIVRRDLVVEIDHPDTGPVAIDESTIESVAGDVQADNEDEASQESSASLQKLIRLVRWARDLPDREHLTAEAAEPVKGMAIDPLRQRLERGDRLAFRLDTQVRQQGSSRRESASFYVYIESDDGLDTGHDYFVRGHLRIPDMHHIRNRRARAYTYIPGQSSLAQLLRDAEGPAHARWSANSPRAAQAWVNAQTRISETRRAAEHILRALAARPVATPQYDILADLFPAEPSLAGSGSSGRPGTGEAGSGRPPGASSQPMQVTRVAGGFTVRGSPEAVAQSRRWQIKFAYDVARGNAFKRYETAVRDGIPDFSLTRGRGIRHVSEGAFVEIASDNVLHLEVDDLGTGDFQVRVIGFDDRDIIVDITPLNETTQDTADDQGAEV